jgi:predicted metal-dependent phosphotriesterase family hydrolase
MTRMVQTVLGARAAGALGITDAHNHLWIEAVAGASSGAPLLVQRAAILAELAQYKAAGGGAVIDCQPGGCGRNAAVLADLAELSGVMVVACSGFHRQRYYAPEHNLWQQDADTCAQDFIREVRMGTSETIDSTRPVRAGFVKAALEATLAQTLAQPLEGAIAAAVETGAALLVHSEKGQAVEGFLALVQRSGLDPRRIILCHVDKRADFGLHRELAQAGVLLEYDTFYRPQYQPESNVWQLIERMAAAGLEGSVALATDMAEERLWRFSDESGAPGLVGFVEVISARLIRAGFSSAVIAKLTGENIAERLAFEVIDPAG